MGWFWADNDSNVPRRRAESRERPSNGPPPSCPMHIPTNASCPSKAGEACSYPPPIPTSQSQPSTSTSAFSKLNPLNYMPFKISNSPSANQTPRLPMERECSTIPKGDGTGLWEYPSPQQMYNAMLRKGYTDTPVDAVESMVAVHNFLNEGAWAEILEWERRFGQGISTGWRECLKGEEGSIHTPGSSMEWKDVDGEEPQLIRFMGRPGEMTPKARLMQAAGWLLPSHFGQEPPFDRHDWIVKRRLPNGTTAERRYVIDYYSGPAELDGMPVFYLDVRPAIDRPAAVMWRVMRWGGDVWYKGTGGKARSETGTPGSG